MHELARDDFFLSFSQTGKDMQFQMEGMMGWKERAAVTEESDDVLAIPFSPLSSCLPGRSFFFQKFLQRSLLIQFQGQKDVRVHVRDGSNSLPVVTTRISSEFPIISGISGAREEAAASGTRIHASLFVREDHVCK